jgi:hypothetical protein
MAPEAAKEFDALDPVVRGRVERALDQLATDPIALRRQIERLRGDVAMCLRVGGLADHIRSPTRWGASLK